MFGENGVAFGHAAVSACVCQARVDGDGPWESSTVRANTMGMGGSVLTPIREKRTIAGILFRQRDRSVAPDSVANELRFESSILRSGEEISADGVAGVLELTSNT